MPKPKNEDYKSLQECSDYIYTLTRVRRLPNTILMWYRKGLIDKHGSRIRLKTARRLKRRYSTIEWIDDFLREIG
jgi:hypothetical protein